jgi:predicted outer membrane repeat protein
VESLEDRWLPSHIGLTVTSPADSGPGTLRAAILAADAATPSEKVTIGFASSLAGQTITLTGGELDITTSMAINGPGASQLTISGDHLSRVFEIDGAATKVTLSGLTITDGSGLYDGGGILNYGTLTVSGCTISGNTVQNYGGGIMNFGTLTLSNCTVSGNSAQLIELPGYAYAPEDFTTYGGGIYNAGTTVVQNSSVSDNFASYAGGGIYSSGTLTLSGSTVTGNQYFDLFSLGNSADE